VFFQKRAAFVVQQMQKESLMANKPTYEELERRVKALEREAIERKRATGMVRENGKRYQLVVKNANDAIFIAQDGFIKFPNPKTEEMLGYSSGELSEIPFTDLVHPEDRDMVVERYDSLLSGEELPSIYSFRIIDKDGEELWVQVNPVLIPWEERPATLNLLRDITPEKRSEAQLQHAQRMEAIGTLASGIAHHFNNLLMGIQGNASLMRLGVESSYPHYEKLRNIEQYVQEGTELTKQLLGVAREGKDEVKPTDLNEIVKNSSQMFGRTKREIHIHTKYQEGIWITEADQTQIQQALLNLYVNAWQAMPGGGNLYLETENVILDELYVKPYHAEPGKYVKVSITDTGVGMDKQTQERIFDLFFTNREAAKEGTGLGLASVAGIIENHGGFMTVYSEKGQGTAFNIYLPVSDSQMVDEKEFPDELLTGTEAILIVDDEDMIITVGSEMLRKLGYKVLLAKSGKEAIELCEAHKETIDMVILDMIMPDMNGEETYDRIKKIMPEVKVLLSSGYSIIGQAKHMLERGCNGFIQKPFNMKRLSHKVREVLN